MRDREQLVHERGSDATVRDYLALMGRYESLLEISRRLNSTLDIKILLQEIIEAATELTDTEVASILLVDPNTGVLRFEAGINPSSQVALESIEVPMEGSIAGWIVQHGEPMLIEDVRSHPSHFQQVDDTIEFSTRNMLGVPLSTHEKTIGALEAINKRREQAFTEDDVNTLTALAAQAAVAIENARLFHQNDLISEMVHELRTPLAALSATTHILLRQDLPEDRRRMLIETIQSETQRLSRMTTDFLDLSRLESGRTRIERVRFDVGNLIAECIQIVQPQATDRLVRISTSIDSDVPELEADEGKLKQVLLNLLTNAIKYNREKGEVFVHAELTPEQTAVRVSVRDTGRGISRQDQEHMFERFYRVPDTEGYAQGTGLGLAIAKRIVEAHDGEIWLESELDVGTTFFFTVPVVEQGFQPPVM